MSNTYQGNIKTWCLPNYYPPVYSSYVLDRDTFNRGTRNAICDSMKLGQIYQISASSHRNSNTVDNCVYNLFFHHQVVLCDLYKCEIGCEIGGAF